MKSAGTAVAGKASGFHLSLTDGVAMVASLKAVLISLVALARDALRLVKSESNSQHGLAAVVAMGTMAASFVLIAWIATLASVTLSMVDGGFNVPSMLFVIALVHVVLAASCAYLIVPVSRALVSPLIEAKLSPERVGSGGAKKASS